MPNERIITNAWQMMCFDLDTLEVSSILGNIRGPSECVAKILGAVEMAEIEDSTADPTYTFLKWKMHVSPKIPISSTVKKALADKVIRRSEGYQGFFR
jgi:hypothetical protein